MLESVEATTPPQNQAWIQPKRASKKPALAKRIPLPLIGTEGAPLTFGKLGCGPVVFQACAVSQDGEKSVAIFSESPEARTKKNPYLALS